MRDWGWDFGDRIPSGDLGEEGVGAWWGESEEGSDSGQEVKIAGWEG